MFAWADFDACASELGGYLIEAPGCDTLFWATNEERRDWWMM